MQIYQSSFFGMLIIFVYFFTTELYPKHLALKTAILVSSTPFFISFSVLCYVDVPMIAFLLLAFLLLFKRHYFISGLVMGISILTKRNSLFFLIPLIYLFFQKNNTKLGIKSFFLFLTPLILVLIPDLLFRYFVLFKSYGLFSLIKTTQPSDLNPLYPNPKFDKFLIDGIFSNPVSIIEYLGPISIIGILNYIIFKGYEKKDLFIVILILSYIFLFFMIFDLYSVRYLAPVFPFINILAGKGFLLKLRRITSILIFFCLIQSSAVMVYTYQKRNIPKEIKESIEFIKTETSSDSRFMVPEIFITEYANRPMIWYSKISLVELPYLFWMANEEEAFKIFKRYDIKYIMVLKERIYDDSKVHHLGGFPKSFVQKMETFSFLSLIFENKKVSLWKILYKY
jgi:4-amino-4-deoxy-L-arabinose transferase-like glycosyltransferase